MAESVRLTPAGVAKYEEQLEHLKTTRRMEIAEQIKLARSFGDLSENAEYDAAKNEQAKNEYDIVQLENMLRNVVVIDEETVDTTVVNVGVTVTIYNEDADMEMTYQLVGSAEADPMAGRISNESPIGKAIIGCRVGDAVDAHTPGGVIRVRVVSIEKQ